MPAKEEKNSISNLYPQTFDSLLRKIYIDTHGFEPNITDLKPSNISDFNDFFNGKSSQLSKVVYFCQLTTFSIKKVHFSSCFVKSKVNKTA